MKDWMRMVTCTLVEFYTVLGCCWFNNYCGLYVNGSRGLGLALS